jgi:enoyl-CoA hydratase/carnithine racemase
MSAAKSPGGWHHGLAVSPPTKPIPLAELSALSRDGSASAGFSPLSSRRYLLFEAGSRPLAAADARRVALWLLQLPCPTIGIFSRRGNDLVRKACDVALERAAEAEPLLANIARSPIAATVFVQLLRATETLPVPDALTAESLAYATLQTGPEYQRWLSTSRPAPRPVTDSGPPVMLSRERDALHIELNRPANRNAISIEMRDALNEALQLVLSDSAIRKVRLSGRGKCFSVGGDLSEFGTVPDPATGHIVRGLALPARYLAQCAGRVEVRLHGPCIGAGIEIPAFARRVIAAPRTSFCLPELNFGLIPGGGGCVSLPRRIGRQRAAYLVLSGEIIDGKQALAWGLVDAIAN